MLDDSLVELPVFLLTLLELLLVLEHNLLLSAEDLLDDLVLVLTHLVNGIVCLHTQFVVLFTDSLDLPEVVLGQRVGLELPGIADPLHVQLFLSVDASELFTAASTGVML